MVIGLNVLQPPLKGASLYAGALIALVHGHRICRGDVVAYADSTMMSVPPARNL